MKPYYSTTIFWGILYRENNDDSIPFTFIFNLRYVLNWYSTNDSNLVCFVLIYFPLESLDILWGCVSLLMFLVVRLNYSQSKHELCIPILYKIHYCGTKIILLSYDYLSWQCVVRFNFLELLSTISYSLCLSFSIFTKPLIYIYRMFCGKYENIFQSFHCIVKFLTPSSVLWYFSV